MEIDCLITDIDNTIADPSERIKRSLSELGRGEVYEKTSESFGGFEEYLSPGEMEEFWGLFLSDRFLQLDKPAPGAADFLNEVRSNGVELFYMTGRHDESGDSMRNGTVDWLRSNGFPDPEEPGVELFMKPTRKEDDKEYKRSLLKERLSTKLTERNVVGLGDHPDDAEAYEAGKVRPILLDWLGLFPREELLAAGSDVLVLESWAEIEKEFTKSK